MLMPSSVLAGDRRISSFGRPPDRFTGQNGCVAKPVEEARGDCTPGPGLEPIYLFGVWLLVWSASFLIGNPCRRSSLGLLGQVRTCQKGSSRVAFVSGLFALGA